VDDAKEVLAEAWGINWNSVDGDDNKYDVFFAANKEEAMELLFSKEDSE